MRAVRIDRRNEDQTRPPVLNALILVTLVTIVVACWYLGYYYLGSAGDRTRWLPPAPFCNVLKGSCHTRLAQHGALETHVALHERRLDITVRTEDMAAQTVQGVLGGRNEYTRTWDIELHQVALHHYTGTIPVRFCQRSSRSWRLLIRVIDREGHRLGSWYDFDQPCQ